MLASVPYLLLLSSTLVSTAISAPLSPAAASGTHHLPLLSRTPSEPLSGKDLFNSHLVQRNALLYKYRVAEQSGLSKRSASSGSVELASNSLTYYTSVELGTPPVQYEVSLDTGSSDLVMITSRTSDACSATNCTLTSPLYSPQLSTSSLAENRTVQAAYGTGSASGVMIRDRISFAGLSGTGSIAACDEASSLLTSSDQSGLMGLGWQAGSPSNSTAFVQQLWEAGKLAEPVFGFGLATQDPNAAATVVAPGGSMTVGGTNSSLYTGSINWVNLSSTLQWSIPLQGLSVGVTKLNVSAAQLTIDTGSNLIVVPSDIAASVYATIPGSSSVSGIYSYPCSSSPQVSFTLGGVSYALSPEQFNRGAFSSESCMGAIVSQGVPSTSPSAVWILGTPFLVDYYTAFRFSPPAVGFATLASTAQSVFATQAVPTSTPGASGVSAAKASATGTAVLTSAGKRESAGVGALLVAMAVAALVGLA